MSHPKRMATARARHMMQEGAKVERTKLCEQRRCEIPVSAWLLDAFLETDTQLTGAWVARTGGDAKSVVDAFRAVQTVAKAG